mmetsp:Transcript_975/g.2366  ORF Transcript_975/g.2366 Transcript_975/m.2366 type:complete len:400 (+) Transcript_975:881-2080(+)
MVSKITCLSVLSVLIISSSFMMCAGLKKWLPMMRLIAFVFAPTTLMSIVDVFVERMQSLRHTCSSSANIFCFSPMSSSAASITMSARSKPSYVMVPLSRLMHCSYFSLVMRPFLTELMRFAATRCIPPSRNFWFTSFSTTSMPLRTHAVAIPLPMSPPPMMATHFIGRGRSPESVTPRIFDVSRCERKTCTRDFETSCCTTSAKTSASFLIPASGPSVAPTRMASRHMDGCFIPGGVFLATCMRPSCTIARAAMGGPILSVFESAHVRGVVPFAIASASCLAAGRRSSSFATTTSTSPLFFASTALSGFDVSIISMAFCMPTRRGRRCVPPNPGMMPSCSSGSPRTDLAVATRALVAMATSHPPPSADPLIAATVGFGPFSTRAVSMALTSGSFAPDPD